VLCALSQDRSACTFTHVSITIPDINNVSINIASLHGRYYMGLIIFYYLKMTKVAV